MPKANKCKIKRTKNSIQRSFTKNKKKYIKIFIKNYKIGKILKNTDILKDIKVENGSTMHMVIHNIYLI